MKTDFMILMMNPQGGESNSMGTFLMLGMIVLIFYFFMIRPQMKRTKDQRKFNEGLKKGDRIVTIGGIHGKIAETKETTMIIEVENGVRLKIEKSAISLEASKQYQNGKETEQPKVNEKKS